MWLFFHGERVNQLVARVKRRVDGPAAAKRVLEVVDEALEEVERTREDGEENRLELRAPQVDEQERGQDDRTDGLERQVEDPRERRRQARRARDARGRDAPVGAVWAFCLDKLMVKTSGLEPIWGRRVKIVKYPCETPAPTCPNAKD